MPCACAEEICRSGSISKNHQLTNLNKCGKFHACIRNSTILALSRLAKSRYFVIICDYFKKICQKHRDSISHIERTVNVLGEDPTKITLTNAGIDKQKALKRDYIYKIENTDLEIGVSGVLFRILFYFDACRCFRQTGSVYALRINLLNIMIQRTLLRGRGTSIINEVKLKE